MSRRNEILIGFTEYAILRVPGQNRLQLHKKVREKLNKFKQPCTSIWDDPVLYVIDGPEFDQWFAVYFERNFDWIPLEEPLKDVYESRLVPRDDKTLKSKQLEPLFE